jgi:hypothetical protein
MLAMQNSYSADWGEYSQFCSDIFVVYLLEQCSFFQLCNLIAVISSVFVFLKLSKASGFGNFLFVNISGKTFVLYSMSCFF